MAEYQIQHPDTGETHTVSLPDDHDGQRVKVEFPDGAIAWTDGWDPAERALAGGQALIACGSCGAEQPFAERFTCSACGALNALEMHVSRDVGEAASAEG